MMPAFHVAQAWQTAFPPNQAGNHFWQRPSVHNGFYQSYTANDFGKKIVRRVCELVSTHDWDWTKVCDMTLAKVLLCKAFRSFQCILNPESQIILPRCQWCNQAQTSSNINIM